jgi:chromosome segregation ATPase
MPTNQEWLHKLANESPVELEAWFDAEHVDFREIDSRGELEGWEVTDKQPDKSQDVDSLAQLESDVRKQLCDMFGNSQLYESVIEPCIDRAMAMRERDVRNEQKEELEAAHAKNRSLKLHISKMQGGRNGWHVKADNLQKQVDAKNNCIENIMETLHDTQSEVDRLQRRNDELRTSYDKLKRERDNLAADLLTCNREREQLRKHLGIALDHAHDICSLVDIDGNVLDVGD